MYAILPRRGSTNAHTIRLNQKDEIRNTLNRAKETRKMHRNLHLLKFWIVKHLYAIVGVNFLKLLWILKKWFMEDCCYLTTSSRCINKLNAYVYVYFWNRTLNGLSRDSRFSVIWHEQNTQFCSCLFFFPFAPFVAFNFPYIVQYNDIRCWVEIM